MEYKEYNENQFHKRGALTIKVTTIISLIFLLILILPDDAFSKLAIYESTTPSYIRYKWLNYYFNVLQLAIVLLGLYVAFVLRRKEFAIITFLMAIREVFLLLLTDKSIFTSGRYEMYLTLLVGYSLLLCVVGFIGSGEDITRLFEWFLISNVLTIYINVLMGGGTGNIEGRYHASNLDVGGTGTLCVVCCIYFLFSKKKIINKVIIIALSLIGLLLSGSRANLLFLIIFFICYFIASFIKNINSNKTDDRRKAINRFITVLIIIAIIVIVYTFNRGTITALFENSRFFSMFNSSWNQDDSILGRTASLRAGFDILKNYPLGISGFFINLQQEMQIRGYPTFPHSTLLTSYLLYGPIMFALYAYWAVVIKKIGNVKNGYTWLLLYFIISTVIYGGPLVNFKNIFMIFIVTFLARNYSETLGETGYSI